VETRIVFSDLAGTYAGAIPVGSHLATKWFASDDPERFFAEGGRANVLVNAHPVGEPVGTRADLLKQLEGVA